MDFLEALALCELTKEKQMKRKSWSSDYPIKYLWITQKNMLVYSVGDGMSAPMLMNVEDYLAKDWEVY